MSMVVNRRAANIHPDLFFLNRLEFLHFSGKGVEKRQHRAMLSRIIHERNVDLSASLRWTRTGGPHIPYQVCSGPSVRVRLGLRKARRFVVCVATRE